MKRAERHEWIRTYLAARTSGTSVGWQVYVLLDAFVWAYIEATGAKYTLQSLGAPKCPQLGRDFSAMFKAGILKRHATGISDCGMGFPKWVWVYELSDAQRAAQAAKESQL